MDSISFIKQVDKCVKEFRKQCSECFDDADVSYYFDQKLKNFIIEHKEEFKILSSLNFDKSFVKFINSYILK